MIDRKDFDDVNDPGNKVQCETDGKKPSMQSCFRFMLQGQVPKIIHPYSNEEYRAENAVLAPYLYDGMIVDAKRLPEYFETQPGFENGSLACIVALAFTDDALGKGDVNPATWKRFIEEGSFIKILSVDPHKKNLTRGFSGVANNFFDFFPSGVRALIENGGCTFEVHHKELSGHWNNKAEYAYKCNLAYKNLQRLLKQPLGLERDQFKN